MRTTVTLADDVVAAVEELRRSEGIGMSEALNRLAREGLARPAASKPYVHKSYDMGQKIDVTNIGEVLGMLDELEMRDQVGEHSPQG
ncbi:ribbon-helix-helix domain-containing protein [Candidatus Poriferisodalis sp.]|uniref:ribbon-helix-helix domain-containing protein n=1 Tax=Candidatus Poriferisodalis sp. TaxID=3101277 RepID=UPI003B5A674E